MSKAVRSDGSVEVAFRSLVDNMESYSKEQIDEVVVAMDRFPGEGKRPKFDQCTLQSLMGFSWKYRELFDKPCVISEYWMDIKQEQSHIRARYLTLKKGNIEISDSPAEDILVALKS